MYTCCGVANLPSYPQALGVSVIPPQVNVHKKHPRTPTTIAAIQRALQQFNKESRQQRYKNGREDPARVSTTCQLKH
jgi:hypothetical protein